jgi:hypothetical protein
VFIEDPLVNSMASFNLIVALEEGTIFVFGSWVYATEDVEISIITSQPR